MTRSILVVEDDPNLATGLCDSLEFEGFKVAHARSGKDAISQFQRSRPDCIILDLMLPDINGFTVCEDVRRLDTRVPILILSARSQEADKIRGLDAGADDYVTKPFSVGELVARVRAMLRRLEKRGDGPGPITVGDASIDLAAQTLTKNGRSTALSFYEVELLRLLHERAGQVVAREEILEKVWGLSAKTTTRSIDNVVVKLRKRVEPKPDEPKHILTIYGTGYKLVLT